MYHSGKGRNYPVLAIHPHLARISFGAVRVLTVAVSLLLVGVVAVVAVVGIRELEKALWEEARVQ